MFIVNVTGEMEVLVHLHGMYPEKPSDERWLAGKSYAIQQRFLAEKIIEPNGFPIRDLPAPREDLFNF